MSVSSTELLLGNNTSVTDENPSDEDVLKILVATDIHLGYIEQDPIRGDDSFKAFEEILQKAVEHSVDFILLGGDLFHENKPSPMCYHRCISLLKKYCLGDKPVAIEFLSDQSRNFMHMKVPIVNYEDPNINVSIPVFSIHGNHDDPTGASRLSAMDIISDTGLINYFGKWTDLTQVDIYPLLMQKGASKLALYGLSHIKDERLSRLFKEKKVKMSRPEDSESWFNIMVLHQNRAQNRGTTNYIPETVLPDFLNLVIWGHEHDCRIDPELTANGTYITQPGSSVATSLAIGESLPKYVGLLQIHKIYFKIQKLKLKTVRPFVFKDITITKPDDIVDVRPNEFAKQQIGIIIDDMLNEALAQRAPESPKLPLLRLVVHFTDESLMSNAIRLGQMYTDKVANPQEMLSFKFKRPTTTRKKRDDDMRDFEEMDGDQLAERVEQLVDKYFDVKKQTLNVLSVKGLCETVSRYIDRNDTDALNDIFTHQFQKTFDKLGEVEGEIDEFKLDELLEQLKNDRNNQAEAEMAELVGVLNGNNRQPTIHINSSDDESDVSIVSSTACTSTVRGAQTTRPARGRGSRGRRARGKGRVS